MEYVVVVVVDVCVRDDREPRPREKAQGQHSYAIQTQMEIGRRRETVLTDQMSKASSELNFRLDKGASIILKSEQ